MKKLISRSLLIFTTLLLASAPVLAQYVWLDEKGVKQFSDQPPPPSVPKNKILKFSGKPIDTPDATTDADADASKNTKQQDSISDKEQAFKKRHDELAAKAKKEAEAEKAEAAKNDSCKRMREYKQALDSGQRITQPDANGNRGFMTDEKRAQEESTINQNLSECN